MSKTKSEDLPPMIYYPEDIQNLILKALSSITDEAYKDPFRGWMSVEMIHKMVNKDLGTVINGKVKVHIPVKKVLQQIKILGEEDKIQSIIVGPYQDNIIVCKDKRD